MPGAVRDGVAGGDGVRGRGIRPAKGRIPASRSLASNNIFKLLRCQRTQTVVGVAVIGLPHPVWGEQVHAIVVLRTGHQVCEADLQAHARRTIAGYKVPKSFEFTTDPLPLSGALKPLKRELRRARQG